MENDQNRLDSLVFQLSVSQRLLDVLENRFDHAWDLWLIDATYEHLGDIRFAHGDALRSLDSFPDSLTPKDSRARHLSPLLSTSQNCLKGYVLKSNLSRPVVKLKPTVEKSTLTNEPFPPSSNAKDASCQTKPPDSNQLACQNCSGPVIHSDPACEEAAIQRKGNGKRERKGGLSAYHKPNDSVNLENEEFSIKENCAVSAKQRIYPVEDCDVMEFDQPKAANGSYDKDIIDVDMQYLCSKSDEVSKSVEKADETPILTTLSKKVGSVMGNVMNMFENITSTAKRGRKRSAAQIDEDHQRPNKVSPAKLAKLDEPEKSEKSIPGKASDSPVSVSAQLNSCVEDIQARETTAAKSAEESIETVPKNILLSDDISGESHFPNAQLTKSGDERSECLPLRQPKRSLKAKNDLSGALAQPSRIPDKPQQTISKNAPEAKAVCTADATKATNSQPSTSQLNALVQNQKNVTSELNKSEPSAETLKKAKEICLPGKSELTEGVIPKPKTRRARRGRQSPRLITQTSVSEETDHVDSMQPSADKLVPIETTTPTLSSSAEAIGNQFKEKDTKETKNKDSVETELKPNQRKQGGKSKETIAEGSKDVGGSIRDDSPNPGTPSDPRVIEKKVSAVTSPDDVTLPQSSSSQTFACPANDKNTGSHGSTSIPIKEVTIERKTEEPDKGRNIAEPAVGSEGQEGTVSKQIIRRGRRRGSAKPLPNKSSGSKTFPEEKTSASYVDIPDAKDANPSAPVAEEMHADTGRIAFEGKAPLIESESTQGPELSLDLQVVRVRVENQQSKGLSKVVKRKKIIRSPRLLVILPRLPQIELSQIDVLESKTAVIQLQEIENQNSFAEISQNLTQTQQVHEQVTEEIEAVSCPLDDQSSTRATKTSEDFQCPICDSKMKLMSSLKRHLKSVHQKEPQDMYKNWPKSLDVIRKNMTSYKKNCGGNTQNNEGSAAFSTDKSQRARINPESTQGSVAISRSEESKSQQNFEGKIQTDKGVDNETDKGVDNTIMKKQAIGKSLPQIDLTSPSNENDSTVVSAATKSIKELYKGSHVDESETSNNNKDQGKMVMLAVSTTTKTESSEKLREGAQPTNERDLSDIKNETESTDVQNKQMEVPVAVNFVSSDSFQPDILTAPGKPKKMPCPMCGKLLLGVKQHMKNMHHMNPENSQK